MFRSIREVKSDIAGKRVLVRASLNAPVINGVTDSNDFRIIKTISTIKFLKECDAHTILVGHVGRDPDQSIEPIFNALKSHVELELIPKLFGPEVESAISKMRNGDVILLENLRSDEGEKENDPNFARKLASYADYYVYDAFADGHRMHASVVGIPKLLQSFAGPLFEEEYKTLSSARDPREPSLLILGGAKFETKRPLIQKFLDVYNTIFIGGALAQDFCKARGYEIGESKVSDAKVSNELAQSTKIVVPEDVVVIDENGNRAIRNKDEVGEKEIINDCGPKTIEYLREIVPKSSFILWNGPLGNYEQGFKDGTEALARIISESYARSIVGGGDTLASIRSLGLENKFSFASTAGGAMLEFLESGTLPVLDALKG